MTIGLEAFVCITKPKYNKSYDHKPERVLGNNGKADKIANKTQYCQNGGDPESGILGGWKFHFSILLSLQVYILTV